jgi:AraC family transcriptional regulator, transcriptional activator of pobA
MTKAHIGDFPLAVGSRPNSGIEIFDIEILTQTGLVVRNCAYRMPCYALLLITEGEGRHQIDSQVWPYRAGTLFLIAVGQVQVVDWSLESAGYQILFTDQYCAKYSSDLSWLYDMPFFNPATKTPVLHLNPPINRAIAWIARRLEKLRASDTDILEQQLQWHLLKSLLLEIEGERLAQGQSPCNGGGEGGLYRGFCVQLEQGFRHCRCVRTYAEALHVTPKKLNRVIQEQVGRTAKQVIDERVVAEIQRLLIHTDLTIQQIGYKMGFEEPSNMTKFFKRYTSCTPAQYKLTCISNAHSYHVSADTDLLLSETVTDKLDSVHKKCMHDDKRFR